MPKCRYAHCKHVGEPVDKEKGVHVGSAYYHEDCYKEKELLREIERYYIDNFERDPIMQALRKVINTIVFTQGKSPEFLMYALRYTKSNNIPLKHPAGIYYLMKDEKIIESWVAHTNRKKVNFDFPQVEDLKPEAGYVNNSGKRGWGNRILSRGV